MFIYLLFILPHWHLYASLYYLFYYEAIRFLFLETIKKGKLRIADTFRVTPFFVFSAGSHIVTIKQNLRYHLTLVEAQTYK
jgi:hypothetical protein